MNKSTELKRSEELEINFKTYGITSSWWLWFHHSDDMPSSYNWNAVEMKKLHQLRVDWKLYSFRLLESPYPTNCQNYKTSSPYLSRRDCIRKCKMNASLTNCKVIHKGIDVQRDDPVVHFAQRSDCDCIKNIDFDTICEKECPHYDCAIDYYKPVRVHNAPDNRGFMTLTIPTDPETAFYHEPKLETIEFICYLASTFGMWFGLSFFSLSDLFSFCHNYLVKKTSNCPIDSNKCSCACPLKNQERVLSNNFQVDVRAKRSSSWSSVKFDKVFRVGRSF